MATLISYKKTGEPETTTEVNGRHNDAFIADEGEEQVEPAESNLSPDGSQPLGLWRRATTEQRTNFRDSNLSANDVAIQISGDKRQPVCLSSGDTSEDQFEIEWANLKLEMEKKWYQKANQKGQSLILRGVDGRIKSGEMTAVLGPSGAGKTSLLNSLFGKYRTLVRGSIKVTGARSKKHLNVSTIPQQDHLIGYLTTEEALWFASRLKNTDDHFDHDANIERVLALLGLERCRATRINKLSGGQHKRVSIAQEMLSSPDVLVLDEPTSGLDSLTCYRTVKVLRSLVEASKANQQLNPMSIILTIHQPQVEVLALFHSVYVMAVGGQTLFQGSPGELGQVIEQQIEPNKSSAGYNDASTIVEIASEQFGRETIDVMVANQRKRFRDSTRHPFQEQNYHHESYTNTRKDIDARIMTSRRARNSGVFWRHVGLMTRRCLMSNIRDPLFFLVRVGSHIFLPILYAFVFGSKVGLPDGCPTIRPEIDLLEFALADNDDKIQAGHDVARIQFQNIGLHFIMAWGFSMAVVGFVALSFPLIMHVLIKEIRNGWYSLGAFFVGKWLAELPMAIILPPISVGIIQLTTGQPSSYLEWRYFAECLILILIIMLSDAKGLIFGPIFMSSMETSVFVASLSTVPFILVAGFFTRIRDIPYVLQQFSKVSYFTYAVQAIIISRYGFGLCPCGESLIPAGGISRIVGIPDSIISMADYYVSSRTDLDENSTTSSLLETTTESGPPIDLLRLANITDSKPADEQSPPISGEHQSQGLLFDKLARLLSKADAFGYTIHDCSEVESYAMKDMQLKDEMLAPAIVYLVLFIILFKLVGYFVIEKCIRLKL